MKFTLNLVLLLLFIPLFTIALLSWTIKYQLLNINFWETTFNSAQVYPKLALTLRNYEETQIVKEGGRQSDAKILTDLITPENVKDFVQKNLISILDFANGKNSEILVYIPLNKIPKGLLPQNLGLVKEQMPITTMLSKFNIPISQSQIAWIAFLGQSSFYTFVLSISLSLIFLIFSFLLTDGGKRFIFPGIFLSVTGIIILYLWKTLGTVATALTINLQNNTNLEGQIVGIIFPPVITSLVRPWLIIGILLLVLGISLFLIKRRDSGKAGVIIKK